MPSHCQKGRYLIIRGSFGSLIVRRDIFEGIEATTSIDS